MRIKHCLAGITLLSTVALSCYGAAPAEGSGKISATLDIVSSYAVTTTPLQFGQHMKPTAGSETISIQPGEAGASTVSIEGSDGEAKVSLENSGSFSLTGENTGDTINAKAFFTGDSDSTTVDLVDGKGSTSVGGSATLTTATAIDDYTGTVDVTVTKTV